MTFGTVECTADIVGLAAIVTLEESVEGGDTMESVINPSPLANSNMRNLAPVLGYLVLYSWGCNASDIPVLIKILW